MNAPAGGARPESPRDLTGPAAAAAAAAGRSLVAAGADEGRANHPTIWGLTPYQLHDRFWASHGIQVVRPGDREPPVCAAASLYLLIGGDELALFDPPDTTTRPPEIGLGLTYVHTIAKDATARERVVTDADGRFVRFERVYERPQRRPASRVAITSNPLVASAWQSSGNWGAVRRAVPKSARRTIERNGAVYDGRQPWAVATFARDLLARWADPSPAVGRAVHVAAGERAWRDRDAEVHPGARLVGPVWIGRGRRADATTMVVGPAVLWDDPAERPSPEPFQPAPHPHAGASSNVRSSAARPSLSAKRAMDIALSLLVLAVTLPLYPLIALAIAMEDGLPVFFVHRRETLAGREFPCLKFRSMRRNAERLKAALRAANRADGPQFHLERDPRLTRVGRFLRRFRIDEWPQFFNVLAGHMSLVGPRPSPFAENQFCPAWRQARLSVRPGITGLWQVSRTRAAGRDFQEWIRYDVEYVRRASLWLDLCILARTFVAVFRR